ncbi:acyl-CoA thioesterase-1 [Microbacterium sp. W4I4]|uniref:SGNH/GDSL hydrolase family protein n=1 Tax=Microbacterium sp. W4I4 TaxID=3042295 RepID=UPI00278498C7|nr:SGNH/GDSL hydrolase family protein [Microbacterium sp. W4I4]MDQ0614511.1 acyl-CoA thioesterase-1 [Microbacterium sp. W4I4]
MTADATSLHALLDGGTPLNWVLTGDSITHGLVHTQGARTYAEHLHELIRGDLVRTQDVVINTAISGWRVVQLLEDFERRVATWRPQVVTLMIGTNDCSTTGALGTIEASEFAASVTEFVARVRDLGAIPVLQTPPTIDPLNAPERSRIGEFVQAIRDVAAAQDTILVDQFARFSELGADKVNQVPWALMGDPFHPNAAGHAVLALGLAEALGLEAEPVRDRVLAGLRGQLLLAH